MCSGYLKSGVLVPLILAGGISVAIASSPPDYSGFLNELYGTSYSCSACHTTVPALNGFGNALASQKGSSKVKNDVQNALRAIELLDSDNDGCLNVTELITGSALPGSAGSKPVDCRIPVANDDTESTDRDIPLSNIDVLSNDVVSSLSGHSLRIDSADSSSTQGGSVSCDSTTCEYTPPPGFCGTDTFDYIPRDIAYDGKANSAFISSSAGTISITVGDLNPPDVSKPTPDPLIITLPPGSTGPVSSADPTIANWLQSASASDPEDGNITPSNDAPGSFPIGDTSVTFSAEDSCGNTDSVTAVVRVQVADNNNPEVTAPEPDPVIVTAAVCEDSVSLSATADNFTGSIQDWLNTASATDIEDGVLSVTNDAPSVVTLGDTQVTFSATDTLDAVSTETATVRVLEAVNEPPVLNAPAPDPLVVIIEEDGGSSVPVTDPAIAAWLASASGNDPEDGPLSVSHDAPGTFFEGEKEVEFITTDACGVSTSLTATVIVDASSPIITAEDRREVVSTGFLTDVPFEASAVSRSGVVLVPTVDDPGPYRPGRHTLIISATDVEGNSIDKTQTLDVLPLVTLGGMQIIGEGQQVTVPVNMNGDAPEYPVQIDFSVAGSAGASDHNLQSGRVTITSGRGPAEIKFTTSIDQSSEPDETIEIRVTGVSDNAVLGDELQHVVRITEREIPPAVSFEIDQNGESGNYIYSDQGGVTVTAIASDPNGSDLDFDWSKSDAVLNGVQIANQFSFDPSALAPGVYRAVVLVDDGTAQVENTVILVLSTTAPVLSPAIDSDGDGVNDGLEGRSDSDGDGVPDFLDAVDDVTLLQMGSPSSDNLVRLMQTKPGTTLALGALALEVGNNGPGITTADIHDGNGEVVTDPEFVILGSAFDFEVRGLSEVQPAARIVIPLSQPAPSKAVYRKFVNGAWITFFENGNDKVRSARSTASVCPPPGSKLYVTGIIIFADCIELIISDGGPNDADGLVNGVVVDPGGIAVAATEEPGNGDAARKSPGGASSFGWLVILFIPIWYFRHRLRSLNRS